MDDNEIGKILVSENDDGKAVWEFEGLVTSNVPLDTDAKDFANAINELSKKLQQEGGGDEPIEDWQPPADWIPVPDPAPNEIYVLIEVIDDTYTNAADFVNGLCKPENGWGGMGTLSVEWGDGEAYTYSEAQWIHDEMKHTYASAGQYLIKITTEIGENNAFMRYQSTSNSLESSNVLICKTGAGIVFSYNGYTGSSSLLFGRKITYFKHFGDIGTLLPYFAQQWYGLIKIEFAEPVKAIPDNAFQYCYALRVFDTSEVLSVGDQAFEYNSGRINSFPKCKKIGKYAFSGTHLSKINISMCESIGDNAFTNCNIKELYIPKCKIIGNSAFTGCYALEKADISACETLGNYAFSFNYNLSDISVPDDCNFGTECFKSCYKLYPRPDGSAN